MISYYIKKAYRAFILHNAKTIKQICADNRLWISYKSKEMDLDFLILREQ